MPEVLTLVVDDDPEERTLTRTLLERAGIGPILEADSAEAALPMAEEHQPTLILLDVGMPGRSGIEVLPDLLAAVPSAKVVVLSNFPRQHYADAAVELGAVGYVEKRVAPARLVPEVLLAAAIGEAAVQAAAQDLPRDPTAPREARALVRGVLEREDARVVETVELLVSELVTNAIVHASSAPRVEVDLSRHRIRVSVHDEDPNLPATRTPDLDRPGGRGLVLLDQLAGRWGAEPSDGGKLVWFELDRDA